jgi:Uri superfamily endonuclease
MNIGVYLLLFSLHGNACLRLAGAAICLKPGLYVYVGSACGPGGLEARLRRHLCGKRKKMHWHIDRLLSLPGAEPLLAVHVPGKQLCSPRAEPWLALAAASSRLLEPVGRGVGSTDDKIAPTHLFLCKPGSIERCIHVLIGIASSIPGSPQLATRNEMC